MMNQVLYPILNEIAVRKSNVLAINQEVPFHNIAYVTLTADVMNLEISIQEFVQDLKKIKNVVDVMLLAVE